jgi:hypothetical protein
MSHMRTRKQLKQSSKKAAPWLACCLFASTTAASDLDNEYLVQPYPAGYVVGYQNRQGKVEITEYVPQGETVNNWTEMVTTQVMLGQGYIEPETFLKMLQASWTQACPGSEVTPIRKGEENGYNFALWMFICPTNPDTAKPEYTWMKAIQGRDSFYLVHKAFKFSPKKEELVPWVEYLRSVTVCDGRVEGRACLNVEPSSRKAKE